MHLFRSEKAACEGVDLNDAALRSGRQREKCIMSLFRTLPAVAVFALLMFAFCLSAGAAPLLTGSTLIASGETDPSGGTLTQIATESVGFTGGSGSSLESGTLTSSVYKNDASNPLGGLTFTFQITNKTTPSSLTDVTGLTTTDFTGFGTDASYQTPTTNITPKSVSRNTADIVGWTFTATNGGVIAPGQTSSVLVVQTNAQSFTNITASLLGGAGASAASFGPVPEPSSLACLGTFAVLAYRRRK